MSKARAVLLLIAISVALVAATIWAHGIGPVLIAVSLVVVLVVGFVALAMNMGRYDWATGVFGKSIDSATARVRAFVRRAWPPA